VYSRVFLVGIFLFLIAGFASLGFWQLDRAEQKRSLFAAFAAQDAVATQLVDGDAAGDQRYKRLELTGSFASSQQILLDWMTHEGQVGYQVLTPFQVAGSDCWLLVNRGWLAGSPDHSQMPDVSVGEMQRTVTGRIDVLPRPGLQRADRNDGMAVTWPRPLLYPTIEEIESVLQLPIAGYQLLLDADAADGFVRAWQPRSMKPENHIGYAVQWFAMSAVLAAIGIGLLVRFRKQ